MVSSFLHEKYEVHPEWFLPSWVTECFWILAAFLVLNTQIYPAAVKAMGHALTQGLLGGLGFVFLLLLYRIRRERFSFGVWFWAAPAAFLAWIGIDWGMHGFRSAQPWTWQSWITGVLLFWAASLALRLSPEKAPKIFLMFLVLIGGVQGLVGIVQWVEPARFIPPFLTIKDYDLVRCIGTLDNPNQYGSYLSVLVPLAVAGVAGSLSRSIITRFVMFVCLALILSGLILSQSRGALVGFGAGTILWALLKGYRATPAWRLILCAGLIVASGLAGFVGFRFVRSALPAYEANYARMKISGAYAGNLVVSDRLFQYQDRNGDGVCDARDLVLAAHECRNLTDVAGARNDLENPLEQFVDRLRYALSGSDENVNSRLIGVVALFNMWVDHPWLGIGPGNYTAQIPEYNLLPDNPELQGTHGHNLPLQLLAEYGVPGLVAFFSLVVYLVRMAAYSDDTTEAGEMARWIGMSLAVVVVNQMFDITATFMPLKYILPCLIALFTCRRSEPSRLPS